MKLLAAVVIFLAATVPLGCLVGRALERERLQSRRYWGG